MLKNVVLPAPFGPISEIDLAARDGEADVVDGDETAELLAQRLGDEQVAVGRQSSARLISAPACSTS